MKPKLYFLNKKADLVELTSQKIELIDELDFIGLVVSSQIILEEESTYVFIGDYGCGLIYKGFLDDNYWYVVNLEGINYKNTRYESNRLEIDFFIDKVKFENQSLYRIFLLTAGECLLKFVSRIEEYDIATIEVIPNKLTEKDIKDICIDLVEKDFYFFTENLSLTRLTSENKEHKLKISHLELIEKILSNLLDINSFKNLFIYDKFSKIENKQIVEEWSDIKPISTHFDKWLIQNSIYSYQTSLRDKTKIYINHKALKFTHGLYDINNVSTDILENYLIHYSIVRILKLVIEIETDLIKEKSNLKNNVYNHFLSIYHKYCLKKVEECKALLTDLEVFFNEYIPVNKIKPVSLFNIERILTKPHYAKVWDIVFNRLNLESNTYGNLSRLLKVNDLATLYEKFCFVEISTAIRDVFNVEIIFEESFRKAKSKDDTITVYYENSELFITTAREHSNLRPDFIIEIKHKGKSFIVIMDAKYKPERYVRDNDVQITTLKYLHGISPKNSYSKVIGLFLLFPKTESNNEVLKYYNNERYIYETPILPVIGIVSLFPKKVNKMRQVLEDIKMLIQKM